LTCAIGNPASTLCTALRTAATTPFGSPFVLTATLMKRPPACAAGR
jgi:hypothetical protein